jgi:hypothetical protein
MNLIRIYVSLKFMTLIPKYRLIVSGATLYFAIIFSGGLAPGSFFFSFPKDQKWDKGDTRSDIHHVMSGLCCPIRLSSAFKD